MLSSRSLEGGVCQFGRVEGKGPHKQGKACPCLWAVLQEEGKQEAYEQFGIPIVPQA